MQHPKLPQSVQDEYDMVEDWQILDAEDDRPDWADDYEQQQFERDHSVWRL